MNLPKIDKRVVQGESASERAILQVVHHLLPLKFILASESSHSEVFCHHNWLRWALPTLKIQPNYLLLISFKNMWLCWIHGSSLLICPLESLGFGEHETIFPTSSEFGPFVMSRTSDPLLSFLCFKGASLISLWRIIMILNVLFLLSIIVTPPI